MTVLRKTMMTIALTMAFSSASYAVPIDPDGAGSLGAADVAVLDWTVGNAIVSAIQGDVQNPSVGDIFQTYAHARLASFNDGAGNPVTGLFGASEWTYVTGFQERVSDVSGTPGTGSATFETIAGGDNFFRIYYSNTAATQSNNLTGFNFADGTLVLEGIVLPFDINDPTKTGQTSFTATTPVDANGNLIYSAFDQFGTDDYGDIETIAGQGGGRIGIQLTSWDAAFFPGGLPGLLTLDFDTQLNVPYTKTNPSACFWDGAGYVSGAGGQGTNCTNTVGAINGISGPNNMLMTDSSTRLQSVPEPISLALVGVGLAGMGLVSRRRKA